MKTVSRILLALLALLLVALIAGPFLIPVRPLEGTVPAKTLADADSRFLEVNGLEVHYKMAGQGGPVFLLLHGFSSSLYSWREVIHPLAEWGTVIAFDRPASGLTERPLDGEWGEQNPYSPEAQADLTVGLLDALGLDRAILVGNSAGGTIAALTALRHPDRVEALILVAPAIYSGGGTPTWLSPLLRTPQMQRLGPLVSRAFAAMGERLARTAWHDPSKLTPAVWANSTRAQKVDGWDRALWEFTLASHPLGLDQRLAELQLPTLVIAGDDDRIVPTEESIRLGAALPATRTVILPNCGHVPQEECPVPFLSTLADFLSILP